MASVKITTSRPIQDLLTKLESLGEGPGLDTFQKIGAALEQSTNIRFDTKQDPDGKKWKPWAPATAELRAKQGRGELLIFSGLLRSSLTSVATKDGVTIGFGQKYAENLEKGTKRMPARGLLLSADKRSLGARDEERILQILQQQFESQFK